MNETAPVMADERAQLYEHADGLLENAKLLCESRARQLRNSAYALKGAADSKAELLAALKFLFSATGDPANFKKVEDARFQALATIRRVEYS